MSTHNICFCGEIRKILCGYPLLSVAMCQGLFNECSQYKFLLKKKKKKKNSAALNIGVDKSGYQVNIFLISRRKHMLWVLIGSASPMRFQ